VEVPRNCKASWGIKSNWEEETAGIRKWTIRLSLME
jgi:hypothetical protein